MYRLALALSALSEPGSHRFRQAVGLYAVTRFEKAVGEREGIVEFGRTGKVAHAEIVKPIEGAGAVRGAHDDFHAQLMGKHEPSIARAGRMRALRRSKFLAAVKSAN